MNVNIVNYEMAFVNGILSKFAWKMNEELEKMGIKSVVTDAPDPKYDINHHIIYFGYKHVDSLNTVMITHLNTEEKIERLREVMKTADVGVCMAQQTIDELVAQGFDGSKLKYAVPAAGDEKLPIPITILTNVYPDGVKRETMLNELAKVINPERFIFRIMGKNWDVDALRALGLNIEYHSEFDREVQNNFLINSKYNLYFGLDQGSMAVLDAINAGLQIIAPLDGFQNHSGVDFPFTTQEELNAIFLKLQEFPLKDWTWEHYTKKHVEIWKELMQEKT
ncbi:MAG: hypothetical protein JWM39_825 [Parcubacteria group bacterium]|nr:hypothetical protein [Parcubacteria group bacterium]